MRRFFTSALVGLSEMAFAVLLVLVFFVASMAILTVSFPKGTGFQDLYGDLVLPRNERGGVTLRGDPDAAPFTASLAEIRRTVKDRPVDAVAWRVSQSGATIGDQHAVQTFAKSAAVISFENQGSLHLDQNSLVVVRRPDSQRELRRRRPALVVLGGTVRGSLRPGESGGEIEFVTAGATTRVYPNDDSPADFAVEVHDDESATFRLFTGSAEVDSGEQVVTLVPNQALTITPEAPLSSPETMPARPMLERPVQAFEAVYGTRAPRVRFEWSEVATADSYTLEVAEDALFERVAFVRELAEPRFVHGNLDAGHYFWRVSAKRAKVTGQHSSARSFRLTEDLEAPTLHVSLPEAIVETDELLVIGRTEPGAHVLIGQSRIEVDESGQFTHALPLRKGPNLVVVEAVDFAGNVSYHSKYVNAKF